MDAKIIFASASKASKSLYATTFGGFEVWQYGKKVFETDQAHAAVEKYNSL